MPAAAPTHRRPGQTPEPRGFTLVEMIIVIAVAGVLIVLAAPGLRDFILNQRLKSVNAQLVADLQFARSEAVARGQFMRLSFRSNEATSCYTIYTSPTNATRCDCRLGAGLACAAPMLEVRTVLLPAGDKVRLSLPEGQVSAFAFDHVSGGIMSIPSDFPSVPLNAFVTQASTGVSHVLRTTVGRTGRVIVCAPASVSVGAPAC